jgi:hypothetical protein
MENTSRPILAQRSIKLPAKKYVAGDTLEFNVPSGLVVKEIVISAHGKANCVFSAGTFDLHKYGVMDALIRDLNIKDGSKVLKGFKGVDVLRRQARYLTGSSAPVFYKKNSSTLGASPSVGYIDNAGTSGQDFAFSETVSCSFENKLSNQWARTLMNTRNKNNVKIELVFNTLDALLDKADGTTVITSQTADINFEVSLITVPSRINMPVVENWRQTHKTINIAGQQTAQPYELTKGARVQGFWVSAYLSSAKRRLTLDEAKELIFQVDLNNGSQIKSFSLYDLQMENLAKSPIQVIQDGAGYCNFLDNSIFETALDTSSGSGILAYNVLVTCPASWDYTGSLQLNFEQDDIEFLGQI